MNGAQEDTFPLAPECALTVVMPARNEAAGIAAALEALTAQRDPDGGPLPPNFFDIIVFANNCNDDTAGVVRAFAARTPHVPVFVAAARLPRTDAHIGTARKFLMDLAAARFSAAGRPRGIIASIDADTIAERDWIGWIAREISGRDAVAGHVTIGAVDGERLLAPVRLLYARELAYRRTLALVEALVDPLPEDPQPRHSSFVGASFAVTASCYVQAGGLPALRRLEDVEFSIALRRIDARIRYSPFVRAATSARLAPRVDGGFGTFIGELHECARRGVSFTVEHPLRTLEDVESRAAVRRIHAGRARSSDVADVTRALGLRADIWLPMLDSALPLGTVYERIALRAAPGRRVRLRVPVEAATDVLRAAAESARSRAVALAPASALDELETG